MLAALLLAAAVAQPAAVDEVTVTATRMVAELTVTARLRCLAPQGGTAHAARPRVVRTFPARGAVVRPGLLVVRVTFDQAMACEGSLNEVAALPNPCPGENRRMVLSYDRRTIRTVCRVEAARQYGFSIGQDPTGDTFRALSGLPAEPARVAFSTSDAAPITGVCEALAADAETAADLKRRGKACA